MSAILPPRLPAGIREAVRRRLTGQPSVVPVRISRILQDLRSSADTSRVTDDELIRQIVMDATDHGLAVHFDRESSGPSAGGATMSNPGPLNGPGALTGTSNPSVAAVPRSD